MYYALYRKYRPLSFDDVMGQEAITTTLRRQVSTGQISHAYLFTGTRGTGKTTCAKILSRAVNCLDPKDGNPCNECDICKGLLEGTLYDVEEIDAASNNGVENIRQIREEVIYAPTAAKYKVYIIDEVHMLSPGAFNALLKTLEEPPAHAIFILATTEIHKVPATILSRCQRFDFLRLPKKTLIEQFRGVLAKEGKAMDDASLDLVAELADGSSRDGLSILDKVIDLSAFEDVERVLGVIPRKKIYDLLRAAADGDTDTMYRAVGDMYNASADLGRLCINMMDTVKNLMIFRSSKHPEALLEKSASELQALKELSERYPTERLLYTLRTLQDTLAMLPHSADKRADTEVCMLRISRPDLQPDVKALTARLATLEQQIRELKEKGISAAPQKAAPVPPPAPAAPARPPVTEEPPLPEPPLPEPPMPDYGLPEPPLPEPPLPEPPMPEPPAAPAPRPKRELPKFDDPFANPSVTSAGKYTEPQQAPVSPAPAPRKPASPTSARTAVTVNRGEDSDSAFVDGWQVLDAWHDVAHTVGRVNRMWGYLLDSVSAVYQGRVILVLVEDKQDYNEIKDPECTEQIRAALVENRKEGYTLKIENCAPDKYIRRATMDHLKKENLFDFGDGADDFN